MQGSYCKTNEVKPLYSRDDNLNRTIMVNPSLESSDFAETCRQDINSYSERKEAREIDRGSELLTNVEAPIRC